MKITDMGSGIDGITEIGSAESVPTSAGIPADFMVLLYTLIRLKQCAVATDVLDTMVKHYPMPDSSLTIVHRIYMLINETDAISKAGHRATKGGSA